MIPKAHIIAWRARAPWLADAQVEQDLIISRAIVELFGVPEIPDRVSASIGGMMGRFRSGRRRCEGSTEAPESSTRRSCGSVSSRKGARGGRDGPDRLSRAMSWQVEPLPQAWYQATAVAGKTSSTDLTGAESGESAGRPTARRIFLMTSRSRIQAIRDSSEEHLGHERTDWNTRANNSAHARRWSRRVGLSDSEQPYRRDEDQL